MICNMKYANLYVYNLKYFRELILLSNNQYNDFTTVTESSLSSFVQYF